MIEMRLTTMKRGVFFLAITCFLMGLATAAFAVPPNQVSRQNAPLTFTGMCCANVNQSVTIKEPINLVPVVVTWSADFQNSDGDMVFGLSVNQGPCTAFGSRDLTEAFGDANFMTSRALEWVILPGDGPLVPGMNSFEVCGGSLIRATDKYVLGVRTLAVRISK